jgi:hypothetical protein
VLLCHKMRGFLLVCVIIFEFHSVQSLLSSRLLSKNLNTTIYKTIILPVVLYASETWSLTLREEHRLRTGC